MKQSLRPEHSDDGETIGEVFARLIDDAKAFARAEIDYYRLMVARRIAGLRSAIILIVVAILIAQAALTTLLIGIGFLIVQLFARIGAAGGILIAAVLGLVISGLLVRVGIGRIAAAGEAAKT